MTKISRIFARGILDSRGNPTVEVDVVASSFFGGLFMGRAAAPSGASTGMHEALELRDGTERYLGKGVQKAVNNVNRIIAPALLGLDVESQKEIDRKMIALDGTKNKSVLGANAVVATSIAVLKCAAAAQQVPLFGYLGGKSIPLAMFNVLNGGKHAGNKLSIQEFMIIPQEKRFGERLRIASEIYHTLGELLVKRYGLAAKNVGDEGGFAPPMKKTIEALDAIANAIDALGYTKDVKMAVDCAASSFYDSKKDSYAIDGKRMNKDELFDFYLSLIKSYPIISIEDPFHEEDFDGFALLRKKIGDKVQIVGDDLLVTNPARIRMAVEKKACNALLLKVNQIGTVTEAMEAAQLCRTEGWKVIVSHRSGETDDSFIADFAVGIGSDYIKAGAPARGERTAKYNQLLRIEEMLGYSETP